MARRPGAVARWFTKVARVADVTLEHAGALGLLSWQIALSVVQMRVRYRDIVRQFYIMGI